MAKEQLGEFNSHAYLTFKTSNAMYKGCVFFIWFWFGPSILILSGKQGGWVVVEEGGSCLMDKIH